MRTQWLVQPSARSAGETVLWLPGVWTMEREVTECPGG